MAKDCFNLSRTSGLSAIKLQSPVGGLIEQHRHAEKKSSDTHHSESPWNNRRPTVWTLAAASPWQSLEHIQLKGQLYSVQGYFFWKHKHSRLLL